MATATIPAASASSARLSFRIPVRWGVAWMPAPLLFTAACFAIGVLLEREVWILPGLLFLALLAALLIAALAAVKAARLVWVPAALVYLLLGFFCAEVAPMADPQSALALLADSSQRSFDGEVVRLGPVRSVEAAVPFSDRVREEHSQQMDLRLTGLGVARVTLYAPLEQPFPRLTCADVVRVTTALHREERYLDPGVWDADAYLHQQGVGALGSARADRLEVLQEGRRQSFACRLHSLQEAASSRLMDFAADARNARLPQFLRIDHEDATMLAAMLTGDRTWLEHRTRVGFERTGSFHLLVVSGLHLAIFSGIVFWLARRGRLSRLWASLVTVALSYAYALFTGFGHPVQRSFWMVTLYLAGRLLWRDRSALNAIGFAALVMLVADPGSLFDAGLQMTLLSVLAIGGVAIPFAEKTLASRLRALRELRDVRLDAALPPRMAQFRLNVRLLAQCLRPVVGGFLAWHIFPMTLRLALRVTELLAASVAIELFMMLPMAVYFHRITLLALPVNVLLVPFLGVLLPFALVLFVTLLAVPFIAFVPGAATAAILHSVTGVVGFFAALRAGDVRVPMPSEFAVVLWIAWMIIAIVVIRLRRFGIPLALTALALAAVTVLVPRRVAYRAGSLEIAAIDVGQGDSLLVITPDGKTLLTDAGGLVGQSPESNFNMGEDVVSPVLWSLGIRRLDAVALTHAHEDHVGGMPAVIANFRPRELWLGPEPDAPVVHDLLRSAAAVGTRVRQFTAGDTFAFGDVAVRVLAPARDYRPGTMPVNNDSLVLRLQYGRTSALLEGDAEAPSEARMVAAGGLQSDFLKVGHHGSRTSTTPDFLAAVAPSYSAISVGRRNFYGHPRREVLKELQDAHVRTYRTDALGMAVFYLDGAKVTAAPWAETAR